MHVHLRLLSTQNDKMLDTSCLMLYQLINYNASKHNAQTDTQVVNKSIIYHVL